MKIMKNYNKTMRAIKINERIESLKPSPKPDIISLLWDFWNQSRIKNRTGKDFHDSDSDFHAYC